jgi:hypothetical protein
MTNQQKRAGQSTREMGGRYPREYVAGLESLPVRCVQVGGERALKCLA